MGPRALYRHYEGVLPTGGRQEGQKYKIEFSSTVFVSFVLQKNPSHKSVLTCFQMISQSAVFPCFEIKRQIQFMLRVGVLPHYYIKCQTSFPRSCFTDLYYNCSTDFL